MQEFDIVIIYGMIIAGARNPRWRGDIGIRDGMIVRLGRIANARARRVIDATGLVVAPGFIDLHTHYDAQVYRDPYLSTSGFHGVTSVVIGNCGFGFAPMTPETRERAMQSMTRVEAIPLSTSKALNILPYVPVNPLLIWAMGFADAKSGRMPTQAEYAEIARLLNEAMDAGACGWSAQCLGTPGRPDLEGMGGAAQVDYDGTPMPCDMMWPETRALRAKVLAERGEGFIALSMGLSNPDEWEKLAELSNAPLPWQALVPAGDEMGKGIRQHLLGWLNGCHERGLRICAQGITQDPPLIFTFDYWDLWGGWNEYLGPTVDRAHKLKHLADPAVRAKLREAPLKYMFIDAIPDTRLHRTFSDAWKPCEGLRISEIAEKTGRHAVDVVCDIVLADGRIRRQPARAA